MPDYFPSPQPITLSANAPIQSISIAIADPTSAGATITGISGSTATAVVFPVAHGSASTTVTFTDNRGASTAVLVTPASCGRPDTLDRASQLIYPPPNTTKVSTAVGKLYFAVYFNAPYNNAGQAIRLHLIAGQTSTLEGGSLQPDTAPPGAAALPVPLVPIPIVVMSATVPALSTGTSYRAQIYDDSCQLPVLTGAFST